MKKFLIKSFFVTLVIIFLIESQLDLIRIASVGDNLRGEISLIEIIQELVLLSILIITIKFRKLFVKTYNKISYFLRVVLVLIIFYEEISFITSGMSSFFNVFNAQNEINLHNSNFFNHSIHFQNINLLFLNISFSITILFLCFSISLLFIGYGSYLPFFRNYRLLFLERKNSIYCLLYVFIEIINFILKGSLYLTNGNPILTHEMLELCIYLLLFKDTFDKIKSIKAST